MTFRQKWQVAQERSITTFWIFFILQCWLLRLCMRSPYFCISLPQCHEYPKDKWVWAQLSPVASPLSTIILHRVPQRNYEFYEQNNNFFRDEIIVKIG